MCKYHYWSLFKVLEFAPSVEVVCGLGVLFSTAFQIVTKKGASVRKINSCGKLLFWSSLAIGIACRNAI